METKTRILIADSNQDFCRLMTDSFSREKDMEVVGVAGDEHQLETAVCRPEPPGGLHAVQLPHLHVQEHQVQFPGVALQPGSSPSPEEKSKNCPSVRRRSSTRSRAERSTSRAS